jgi:hypothetical protein
MQVQHMHCLQKAQGTEHRGSFTQTQPSWVRLQQGPCKPDPTTKSEHCPLPSGKGQEAVDEAEAFLRSVPPALADMLTPNHLSFLHGCCHLS